MRKLATFFGAIGLAFILSSCATSTTSTSSPTKEVKIIHEYHFYYHVDNQKIRPQQSNFSPNHGFNRSGQRRPNQRFGNPGKGVDPRYDHKPGQTRPNQKLGNPGRGIDPRYDHKTGQGRPNPKKENTTSK